MASRHHGKHGFSLAVAASVLVAGTASAAELGVGVRSLAESMNPHFSAIGINVSAMKNVYETLTARDDDLQLQPGLTERRALLEDAMELTVEDLMAIPIVNLSAIRAGNAELLSYRPRADEDTIAINADPVS